jgi:hypothetical protein
MLIHDITDNIEDAREALIVARGHVATAVGLLHAEDLHAEDVSKVLGDLINADRRLAVFADAL